MAAQGEAIRVEPSGDFLGNDGGWSTFFVKVGSPPQTLRVLASTQVPEIWLVDPLGCTSKDLLGCTEARGGFYHAADSSNSERPSNSALKLGAESNLGMTQNSDLGIYGFDIVGIGRPGNGNITLKDPQVVATLATKDFFLGNLGLSARRVSVAGLGQPAGLLTSLKDGNYIPSLSYGYTAGAEYQKSNASLTFGGFDRSKFTPNDIEFPLATPETRELVVELQSVASTDPEGNKKPLLVKKIPMLLDSTVSHIWLPVDTCQQFEHAFGLVYDSDSNFYYVDDKLHDQLKKNIANITFALGVSEAGGPVVNITLPYASFDLDISRYHPEAKRASKYFPLRQAQNESQYTLGRALFQELYLTVNHETQKFSVSQALHAPDDSSNIVAIPSAQATGTGTDPTDTPKPPVTIMTTTPQPSPKSRALATPAIAGIAIALVVLALLAGGIILNCHRRKRKARRERRDKAELPSDPPLPRHARELDGTGRPDPQKGVPDVTVEEKDQAQMDQTEVRLMDQGNTGSHGPMVELPSPDPFRPELPSQDSYRFELPSPEPFLRSELSTPEPIARSELSTPEPGWPGSSELEDGTIGEPSPPLDGVPSPVSSPSSLRSRNRGREPPFRKDSSESEAGWPRTGSIRRSRPSLRHSRMVSSESESSFHPDRVPSRSSRPTHVRMDSSESESGGVRANFGSLRPLHQRLDSTGSVTTMETRLALNSPAASFFPPRPSHDRHERPVQGLPSVGPDPPLFSRPSPSLESIRSGLLSPAPLEYVDERKARDFSTSKQSSGDRPPQKEG